MIINKKSGFTLVELLVVISIIGILASIALVSFQGVQKRSRDTQRQSDLKQYQTALEAYASRNNGLYPAYSGFQNLATVCDPAVGVNLAVACPEDPKYDESNPSLHELYQYMSTVQVDADDNGKPLSDGYVIWAENEASDDYWIYCSDGRSGNLNTGPLLAPPDCPLTTN